MFSQLVGVDGISQISVIPDLGLITSVAFCGVHLGSSRFAVSRAFRRSEAVSLAGWHCQLNYSI